MRTATGQITYEERMRARITGGGPDALEAAIALMEQRDPCSLEEAMRIFPAGDECSPACRDVLMDAWDCYFHIRGMSWD
jgi:hypothetical protein